MSRQELPAGRFRYKPGSYGGPGRGYMPSILCYKERGPESWEEHFCLVKPDALFDDEDAATAVAEQHLDAARKVFDEGGGNHGFALSLRHEGYKSVSDFRLVRE